VVQAGVPPACTTGVVIAPEKLSVSFSSLRGAYSLCYGAASSQ
jgi:hypothetical protein